MKRLIAIFLLLFAFGSYAQKVKRVKNKEASGLIELYYVLKSDKTTRHGKYSISHDKNKYVRGQYNNGQRVGLWVMTGTYTDDDAERTEEEYDAGKIIQRRNKYGSGIETVYYFNGKDLADSIITTGPIFKKVELPIEKGKSMVKYFIHGERDVYAAGTVQKGKRVGFWTFTFNNLVTTVNYINGRREGELRTLTKEGALIRVQTYKNGKLHGLKIAYYESGDTLLYGYYVEGNYVGQHKIFYRNGSLFSAAEYLGNRLIEYTAFSEDGEILPGAIENGNGTIHFYSLRDSMGVQRFIEKYRINIKNGYRHGEEQVKGKNIGTIYVHGIATEIQNIKLKPQKDTTHLGILNGGYYSHSTDAKVPVPNEDNARRTIAENLRFPPNAYLAEKQGTVLCKFYIDEFGEIYHVETINEKLGYGLEQSAEDAIWYLNYTLSASIDFGCPFNTVYQIPIKFQLY
ncbi:hypothetical protein GYB22_00010 [bacterium]|nr:hypothetical protein [bacterium]